MIPGKFYPGKSSKPLEDEILTVSSWSDLNNIPNVYDGLEVFVDNPIGGDGYRKSNKILTRYSTSAWNVPGADFNSIKYINENQIIRTSPTLAKNTEIFGKSLTYTFGASPLGYFMDSVGKGSNSACTFTVEIKNFTNKVVKACKFVIATISNNNCQYFGQIATKGDGSEISPSGSWSSITWSGSDNIIPNNLSGSYDTPYIIISDNITIPNGLSPNDSLIVWFSCVGDRNKEISFIGKTGKVHYPALYAGGNFGVGNFCKGDTVLFENIDYGQPATHTIFEYEDTTPIVKVLTIGDSDFSESVPSDKTPGNGWCYVASDICRTSGINWRITSFAQDGIGHTQFLTRLKSILRSPLKNEFDMIAYQAWTGNEYVTSDNEYNTFLQHMNEAKALTLSAGLSFCTLSLYPACMGPELSSSDQGVREYYENAYYYYNKVYAHMTSGNYNYFDISPVVTIGIDYNPIDSTDGSHALIGTSANPIGQYKQGVALVPPLTNFYNSLGY